MLVQSENNLLSGGENAPTILLKLSQSNWIPSVWHTLILREFFSTFPLALLLSVSEVFFNFFERLFQADQSIKNLIQRPSPDASL